MNWKPSSAPGASVDEWFSPGRFALILALLVFAMFPDVILGQATFYYRDYGIYSYPLAYHHKISFWRGEVPLWNPLSNAGLPFLAQWNTMTLYPLSLFYLLLPLPWSLGVFCLLHLYLAGFGMYLLARRWTGNPLAAAVAGVAFAFNGFTWHALMWTNIISGLAWMPWVVLAVERAWTMGRKWIVAAAVAGTMQMLTGAAEVIVLTWLLLVALWIGERGVAPMSHWRDTSRSALRWLAVIVLITGLAAAQLAPFLDLLGQSQRDFGYSDSEWAMPGLGWGNLLVPLFYCYRSFQGVFVQYGQYWTTSYYLAVGILLMATWTLWHVRERRVWILAGACAVSLVLALGHNGYLYSWLRVIIPQIGFMRFPVKFVMLVVFLLPLIAAFGLARFRDATTPSTGRKSLTAFTSLLAGGMLIVLWCARVYPMPKDDWPATWNNFLGRAGFLITFAALLALLGRGAGRLKQAGAGLALLALLWADVRTHSPELNPRVPSTVYSPGLVGDRAASGLTGGRFMVPASSLARMRHTALPSTTDDYLGRRLALFGNCNLLDQIPKLNGFFPLTLPAADDILFHAHAEEGQAAAGLIDFLNVDYTVAPGTLMDWTARSNTLPLITAGQRPVFASPAATLEALLQPGFHPRQEVYLPAEARSKVSVTNQSDVRIVRAEVRPHAISFGVDAPAPALVTVAQAFYHPWKAFVDGRPVSLWRGNYAFQTMEVPAGRHEVKLVYHDNAFRAGVWISLGTFCICVVLGFREKRRAMQEKVQVRIRTGHWTRHE